MIQLIQIILLSVLAYLVVGVIFSIFFYRKGLNSLDENASGSTIGFKLIIFPGVVVFWPFLLLNWKRGVTKN
jgi:hypothetical protein